MLRIDPRERAGGPVSIQLFGEDPAMMSSAVEQVVAAGADVIDINMGCPVAKVQKTGAGAALLGDPERAVAVARAAVNAAGGEQGAVPVSVKLRSGLHAGDTSGFQLAHRLVDEAGVSAIAFHPRSAAVAHKGLPDYELAAALVDSLPAPVILTGGLSDAQRAREAFERTGASAVMLARGALGNPWLFSQLLGERARQPDDDEVLAELAWTIERAVEHLGEQRAARYLRKFYPWYVTRLRLDSHEAKRLLGALQAADTLGGRQAAAGRLPRALRAGRLSACRRAARAALYCCARRARQGPRQHRVRGGFAHRGPFHQRAIEGHMPKDVILTPEGLTNLKEELELLSTAKRREVAERIKEAREFGDISENSEYDDAKNEQAMLEARIAALQEKLRLATVIQADELSNDVVQVGSVVHVKDEKTGKSAKYTIVGSAEASPQENKLSNESPVGRALLGRKRNETVAVKVPRGPARKLKVTKIDVGLK